MSRALSYTPPTPPDTAASDELADLVAALHESGLLRASAGTVRAYPELVSMLLDNLDARTLRSLVALSGALQDLDPDRSERAATGIRRARLAAVAASSGRPESALKLWRRLRDPDTRRGISAALAALSAVGKALGRG